MSVHYYFFLFAYHINQKSVLSEWNTNLFFQITLRADAKCIFLAIFSLVQSSSHWLRGRIASARVKDNLYLLNEWGGQANY